MNEPQDHLKTAPKTYTFTQGGKEFTIPSLTAMPIGVQRKARKAVDDADRVFIMLEEAMGEGSPELAAVDAMDPEQFQAFLEGWTQGATVGEA